MQQPQTQSPTGPAAHGKRRRPSAPQDPAEAARRYQQRKLREEALKNRAQGQGFVPNKKRKLAEVVPGKAPLANKPKYVEKPRPGRGYGNAAQAPDEDAGSRPMHKVKVIIVPIYWNRKKEEKAQVLAAAARVEKVLQDAAISCGVDSTNKLTPGQKFRFWEEKHVKIRIELGPKEAAAGQCVLAKCKKPGAVAAKTTVRIGPALVDLVQPSIPETAPAALPADANGETAAMNHWNADPEGEAEAGGQLPAGAAKGKAGSQAEKDAKKALKKRARQLQREAAADISTAEAEGTFGRKAASASAATATAAGVSLAADTSAAEPSKKKARKAALQAPSQAEAKTALDASAQVPSNKKAKKAVQQPLSQAAPAKSEPVAADINRWDADPEAAAGDALQPLEPSSTDIAKSIRKKAKVASPDLAPSVEPTQGKRKKAKKQDMSSGVAITEPQAAAPPQLQNADVNSGAVEAAAHDFVPVMVDPTGGAAASLTATAAKTDGTAWPVTKKAKKTKKQSSAAVPSPSLAAKPVGASLKEGDTAAPSADNVNRWDADPEAWESDPLPIIALDMLAAPVENEQAASSQLKPSQHAARKDTRDADQQPVHGAPFGKKLQAVAGVSGDDLGDEFDIAVDDEDERSGKKRKGSGNKQMGRRSQAEGRDQSLQLPNWQSEGLKSKPIKQVVF